MALSNFQPCSKWIRSKFECWNYNTWIPDFAVFIRKYVCMRILCEFIHFSQSVVFVKNILNGIIYFLEWCSRVFSNHVRTVIVFDELLNAFSQAVPCTFSLNFSSFRRHFACLPPGFLMEKIKGLYSVIFLNFLTNR